MNTPAPGTTSFSQQAAKLSWVCPLLIVVLLMFSRQAGAQAIIELVSLLLMVVGLVFGVVALFGIRTRGKSGILAPAIVGLVINSLLLSIFVTNFMAARARAQRANAVPGFAPVAHARQGNGRQTYRGENLTFDFDSAYTLKANNATGQILLQHGDSHVVITSLGEVADVTAKLKSQVADLQQGFRSQSYGGITEGDFEAVDGSIRSGSVGRFSYDRVDNKVHVNAEAYILSNRKDAVSVLHLYPAKKEATAKALFQTLLRSLKDGA
jgi:hypothetical protein